MPRWTAEWDRVLAINATGVYNCLWAVLPGMRERKDGLIVNISSVSGKRAGETRFAACVILATTRADVNNVARRELDVRKASFAAMDVAVAESGMEYGGITPVGLPAGWPVAAHYPDVLALQAPFALGYVSLIGAALAMPATLLTAGLGVRVAHAMSKRMLEIAFGSYLFIVGGRFVISLISGQ